MNQIAVPDKAYFTPGAAKKKGNPNKQTAFKKICDN